MKVGTKNLYVFDPNGETKQVSAPCVLDFYVHESRQRSGHGKKLFQTMLDLEGINPNKLAIDRPSEKLVGFLKKHYGKSELNWLFSFIDFHGINHQQVSNVPYPKWITLLCMKDFSTHHSVNSNKLTIEDWILPPGTFTFFTHIPCILWSFSIIIHSNNPSLITLTFFLMLRRFPVLNEPQNKIIFKI